MKTCRKCGVEKPLEEFGKPKQHPRWLSSALDNAILYGDPTIGAPTGLAWDKIAANRAYTGNEAANKNVFVGPWKYVTLFSYADGTEISFNPYEKLDQGLVTVRATMLSAVESKPASQGRIKTSHFFLFKSMEDALPRSD